MRKATITLIKSTVVELAILLWIYTRNTLDSSTVVMLGVFLIYLNYRFYKDLENL